MDPHIPLYISALFICLTLILFFFLINGFREALNKLHYPENKKRKFFLFVPVVISLWLVFLTILSMSGFFKESSGILPHILLALFPPIFLILGAVLSKPFKILLFQIPPQQLINLQSFRIFLEILLWLLYINHIIPVELTFFGMNYDIIAGITAPMIAYFAFKGGRYYPKVSLVWNLLSLGLLLNMVVVATLSLPTPFRQFTDGPANTFIAYYPFVWLPGFIVPFAFFLHFASIRQTLIMEKWQGKKRSVPI